jgi:hypothetical protein
MIYIADYTYIGVPSMSNTSALRLPIQQFEMVNSYAIGWFFLFEKQDLYHNLERFLKISDNGPSSNVTTSEVGESDEPGEDVCEFRSTVTKALSLMNGRLNIVKSKYLTELFDILTPLKDALQESNPEDEIVLDCVEIVMLCDTVKMAIKDLEKTPKKLDEAILNPDYRLFYKLAKKMGQERIIMTGNLEKDLLEQEKKFGFPMQDALLGV